MFGVAIDIVLKYKIILSINNEKDKGENPFVNVLCAPMRENYRNANRQMMSVMETPIHHIGIKYNKFI